MKKVLKWVLIGVGGLIVLGIIGSALGGSNNKTSSTNQNQQAQASPSPTPMKVTATQLADAFDENQIAAEKEWGGKLVEFSATISNITDSGVSFYDVATKDFSLAQIRCKITNKDQLLSIKNGQTITVRGVVGKQTIGVIDVNDCQIVQ